ncbi:MAG: B12-binding domain-containing radical SAM protein [Candidatus Thorarchaeota archaeon]
MLSENIIIKDWRTIDISFGLIYPNIYDIGMSSYSIRLLYFLINSINNIACERIFLPSIKIKYPASKDYSPENLIRSLENNILPQEFDILGFSYHFENDFKNILWILEKANIPINRQERQYQSKINYPIIIGGGPVVTSNPILLSNIFDFLFIGDAEPNLFLFFKIFQEFKEENIIFQDFMEKAIEIEGIFAPSINNKIDRAVLKNLDDSPIPVPQLLSYSDQAISIFQKNFFLEINRGCPYQCKFCISSFHNSPFRNRSFKNIITAVDKAIKYSKFETFSLIGSCVSVHPDFKEICEYIIKTGKRLTIPSIRVEHINEDIINILEESNVRTITIAPEAGSDNLRYSLGKLISNDKIISILQQIRDSKIRNVKFYFLIGLPNENENDINEIISLIKLIDQMGFEKDSLRVNVNPFVPKLNTPYEKGVTYYIKDKFNELIAKYKLIERELKRLKSVRLKFKNFKKLTTDARIQTIISLGDREISELLFNYYQNASTYNGLRKAEEQMNLFIDDYLLKIKNCYSPWII